MRDLPRLLQLWPQQVANLSLDEHGRMLERLRSALRRERQMGVARRWSYDIGRHAALLRALKAETELHAARLHDERRRSVKSKVQQAPTVAGGACLPEPGKAECGG
jgi:hypothetical protein